MRERVGDRKEERERKRRREKRREDERGWGLYASLEDPLPSSKDLPLGPTS